MEGIEHQQRELELFGGEFAQFGIVEQLDQRLDVVTAQHGPEQFHGLVPVDQRGCGLTFGDGGEKAGFDIRGLVHARRHPVGQQIDQHLLLSGRRILQQQHQLVDLFGIQRQWWNTLCGTFLDMFTVGFEHVFTSLSDSPIDCRSLVGQRPVDG